MRICSGSEVLSVKQMICERPSAGDNAYTSAVIEAEDARHA